MGPYCQYCDHRCFEERVYPTEEGWKHILMATCDRGMRNDQEKTGYDFRIALNPATDPRFQYDRQDRVEKLVEMVVEIINPVAGDRMIDIYHRAGKEIIINLPGPYPGPIGRSYVLRIEEIPTPEES